MMRLDAVLMVPIGYSRWFRMHQTRLKAQCENHPHQQIIQLLLFDALPYPCLGAQKALSSFRKGGVVNEVHNQGLGQPTSDNYHSVHARMSENILKPV